MGAGVEPLVPDQMDTAVPEIVTEPPLIPVRVGQVPVAAGIVGSEPVVVTGPVVFDPPSSEPPLEFPEPELGPEGAPDDPELVTPPDPLELPVPPLPSDPPPPPPPASSPSDGPFELPPPVLAAPFEVPVPVLESGLKGDVPLLLPLAHAATYSAAAEARRTWFSFRAMLFASTLRCL
jgi:hypothetical protein